MHVEGDPDPTAPERHAALQPQQRAPQVEAEPGQSRGDDPLAPLGHAVAYQILERMRAFDFRITSTMARSKKLVRPNSSAATRDR